MPFTGNKLYFFVFYTLLQQVLSYADFEDSPDYQDDNFSEELFKRTWPNQRKVICDERIECVEDFDYSHERDRDPLLITNITCQSCKNRESGMPLRQESFSEFIDVFYHQGNSCFKKNKILVNGGCRLCRNKNIVTYMNQ